MASQDSAPIVSPSGIIHVLGYTPSEGERGVPITVRIHFSPDLADAMFVRLVVGTKALPTNVSLLPAVSYGRWQLRASAPPLDHTLSPSSKVLISVQALSADNNILDSVTFGEFSYWAPGTSNNPRSLNRLPRLSIPETPAQATTATTTIRRRANSHMPTPSPSMAERSPFPKSPQTNTRLHRRIKAQSLVRTKQNTTQDQDDLHAQTPILDLVTPLSSVCVGWSQPELAAGRRLVRFAKVQDGRRLIVSCEAIMQEEYCENDSVISCIYRAESDTCYVTSVDVIYLLERLTNGDFPVEEKNRIRRNLEGLRPTTVSKHKAGFTDFFQRIMEFPDPKPRNIEKDLKVFEWNLLGQALEKILNKYSIYTSPPESADSSPVDTPPASADSPELYALQLSYPPPEEPSSSRFLDQKVPKFEPFPDEFSIPNAPTADTGEPFPSPVDSVVTTSSSASSSSAFPLFSGEQAVETQATTETHTAWTGTTEFKAGGDMALEHFVSSYEVVESSGSGPIHNFADNSGLDFNMYDSYGFQTISDDTLASLADPYNI